jgi:HEAT repeat protein
VLRALTEDQRSEVRETAMKELASLARAENLPLLRELASDPSWYVRAAAIEALGRFAQVEALPLLREGAEDEDSGLRDAAINAQGKFGDAEASPVLHEVTADLPLLRERALASNDNVAAEAIRSLAQHDSREELEAFLNEHDKELSAGALSALDELLYMPEWMKPEDSAQER